MNRSRIPVRLRRSVRERAQGRCEYCRLPEHDSIARHQIDHILSRKHKGPTVAANLAYCCVICNKRKGPDLSSLDVANGELTPLFHPRQDVWAENFRVVGLRIVPLTSVGRVTAQLLQLNHPDRIGERRLARECGLEWP